MLATEKNFNAEGNTKMMYMMELLDDNGNGDKFQTNDLLSIEKLCGLVKVALKTEGYERFSKDGAIVVYDDAGSEIARADGRSGWSLQRQ